MIRLRTFLRDNSGAGAAEFALILPVMLTFLLGIIDVGRFAWQVNEVGKAVQVGARRAVVTDLIPNGLSTYSYAISDSVPQGTVVPQAKFPGITCTGTSTAVTCNWKGTAPTGYPTNNAANMLTTFKALVSRMQDVDPDITYANVQVDYDWSGLGFAGDPNGPDVAPLTKVTVVNLPFKPITTFLFGASFNLPSISYSLTMEDGSGTESS
ncbi:MAG: pilus assembly protein [Sphingomonadales bacterium]|nr:pilus assembly protein [Sphingomonadales bacterium]